MTTELEALEQASVESGSLMDILEQHADAGLERDFRPYKPVISTIDGVQFIDGKRRIPTKPKCNLEPSTARWSNIEIVRQRDVKLFLEMAPQAVGFRHRTPRTLANILASRLDGTMPLGLWDNAVETQRNRTNIQLFNIKVPESENPEHTLWARESRNASPSREKEAGKLSALLEYRELNESAQPLQSNWGKADNDNFDDPEWEEGDLKKPQRDAEAELETRPNLTELIACSDVPTVQYETRRVGLNAGPKLSDCGYCMFPTSPRRSEIVVPVSGDVECMVKRSVVVQRGNKTVTLERHKLVMIDELTKNEKWSFYRIGSLIVAPRRFVTAKKTYWKGAVTHYWINGRRFRAKEDVCGTPYGPAIKRSNPFWKPLNPRTSKRTVALLSPAERAKQLANKAKPIPCLPPTDEALEEFRLKLLSNGIPANDNHQHDGLPYDVESKDELQFGYAFGKTHADKTPAPFDDASERRQMLAEVNARLSPQARLVTNMVVQTDETEILAQNYAGVGAAIFTGRKKPSERTLMRHGKQAVNDAAKEIGTLRQELAA